MYKPWRHGIYFMHINFYFVLLVLSSDPYKSADNNKIKSQNLTVFLRDPVQLKLWVENYKRYHKMNCFWQNDAKPGLTTKLPNFEPANFNHIAVVTLPNTNILLWTHILSAFNLFVSVWKFLMGPLFCECFSLPPRDQKANFLKS